VNAATVASVAALAAHPRRPDHDYQRDGRRLIPVDLGPLLADPPPEPERICGGLLYPSGLHSLAGPPEAGKTTLAYSWAVELLEQGQRVVILDEESGREQVVDKLLGLGAAPHAAGLLDYLEFPGLRFDEFDVDELRHLLLTRRPALVIVDSSSALLSAAGLDESSNRDAAVAYRALLRCARESTAAVVVLDHLTKDETAGRYARGAGVKLGLVDVALRLDPLKVFTREQSGLLKLEVNKDRRGYLPRSHEVAVEVAAGHLFVTVRTTEQAMSGDGLRPAVAKLLEVLVASDIPLTQAQVVDGVSALHGHGLRRETVSRGLGELLKLGLVDKLEDYPSRWMAIAEGVTT